MIETLFMANSNGNGKDGVRRQLVTEASQENLVLNPKKSQNIAILLRALNVTVDEVCEALVEGEERVFISPVFAFCVCRDVFLIVVLKHWILVLSCSLLLLSACCFCFFLWFTLLIILMEICNNKKNHVFINVNNERV